MRFTKQEYQEIGFKFSLLIEQSGAVCMNITASFPRKHKLCRLACRTLPSATYNEHLQDFRDEFENWCLQDLQGQTGCNPSLFFSQQPRIAKNRELLVGIPPSLSRQFFSIVHQKGHRTYRKKPRMNRLELIVSTLFFHHLGDEITHIAMGAIERNFPATQGVYHAQKYLDSVRKIIQALQEELANIEAKEAVT